MAKSTGKVMTEGSIEAKEAIERVENSFVSLLKQDGIKYKSAKYYEIQSWFFNGAMMAMNHVPVKWGVCLIGRREIVEDYDNPKPKPSTNETKKGNRPEGSNSI